MILLVDGMNCFLRSMFAINTFRSKSIYNPGGAIGFIRTLTRLMQAFNPDSIFVAWDTDGGSRKRKRLYKGYKSGRINLKKDRQEEVREQLLLLEEYLDLSGIHQRKVVGIEADDILGQLCQYYKEEEKIIVSSDKDLYQLIDEKTKCYSLAHKKLISSVEVLEDFGVLPENLVYFRAILGDNSDSIKGVHGVGEKTIGKMFPFLKERLSSAQEMLDCAQQQAQVELDPVLKNRFTAFLTQQNIFIRNISLMQLKIKNNKQISRSVLEEVKQELEPSALKFKFRYLKDCLPTEDCAKYWEMCAQMLKRRQEKNKLLEVKV